MKLSLLSRYRTQLMGVAILWVMFYHSHLDMKAFSILEFIQRIGYGGVDIFIFVSGFGVYFSISKDSSIRNFYKKRVLRIFPYYFPVVLVITTIAVLMGVWQWKSFFYNLTTLGFWFNVGLLEIYDWYIPALLALYLFTPLFYKFFKKSKTGATLTVIILTYIINYTTGDLFWHLGNFTFRIPLYVIGFWLADFWVNHKDFKINKPSIVLLSLSLITGIALLYYVYFFYNEYFITYGFYLLPFVIITFPLCMFLSYFFSFFPTYRFPILTFFGTHSLTLFIFHEKILFLCSVLFPSYIEDWIAFAVTIVLAYVWQKTVDAIITRYTRPKKVLM